jgi:hypothetical protein
MANMVGANMVGANIVGANIVGENVFSVAPSTIVKELTIVKEPTITKQPKEVVPKRVKENQRPCCGCYEPDSTDARCCGVCYCCCPAANIDKDIDKKRCDCCPNDFSEYWYSGLVQTTMGYGNSEEDINGCCCFVCFPIKFAFFFPCFFGSLLNHAINSCCCQYMSRRNYLF